MRGPGVAKCGYLCAQGPTSAFLGPAQVLHHPEDRVGVAIGIAAHGVDGHLHRGIVLADRAVAVEIVAPLVPEPVEHPQAVVLQPLLPHVAPAVPDDGGVGRRVGDGEGRRAPGQLVGQHRAAHEMDVVGIAVIGGAQRDDGAERLGLPRGDLQAVEPAPADPDHADLAGAPGLRGEPFDHGERVILFL
jgi:hypothetical protein